MEITFVWSWLSFIAGAVSVLVGGFVLLFAIAIGQWRSKQKKQTDSVEKLFAAWGGRDNSSL
jgi:hypothetical protein